MKIIFPRLRELGLVKPIATRSQLKSFVWVVFEGKENIRRNFLHLISSLYTKAETSSFTTTATAVVSALAEQALELHSSMAQAAPGAAAQAAAAQSRTNVARTQSVEFVVKAREDLFLDGAHRTIPRVTANEPYPCQMQKNQNFSCLFRHYAKHNGLRQEDLVFSFVDELKPDETPETVALMGNDEVWVERKTVPLEEKKPDAVSTALENFASLLENPAHADVTFLVGEEKKEIQAHKGILSARSPYFAAMLRPGGMSESSQEIVEIRDHSSKIFTLMLEFLYSGSVRGVESLECSELASLLELSNAYLVEGLGDLCEWAASRSLSMSNIVMFTSLSAGLNAQRLRTNCLKFVKDHLIDMQESTEIREEIRSNPELALLFFDASIDREKDSAKPLSPTSVPLSFPPAVPAAETAAPASLVPAAVAPAAHPPEGSDG